ncbi:MAG TPA: ATP-binding protein [Rhizomicrobium sp.]|nr:ATP-binding protein [Rhizomicrobium sp.]
MSAEAVSLSRDPRNLPSIRNSSLPLRDLFESQGEIIDLLANGASLRDVLDRIALLVERLAPPALCSIVLLKRDGKHLRPAAAPSLPEAYCEAIEGVEIGPNCGSCGTAAFTGKPVIVTDIATDPLWEAPREFVLSFGLRACWSLPIITEAGTVLGTIAMYYREPRAPSDHDFGLLEPCARLVRLALAQHRSEEELRETEARWNLAAEATNIGTYDVELTTGADIWSAQFKRILGLPETTTPSLPLLLDMIHPDDRPTFRKSFGGNGAKLSAAPDYLRNVEMRIRRASDGEERIVAIKGRVIRNNDGIASRAIGTLADITVERRRERELAGAMAAAEQANRAKSQFLASMSHELRTPLNAIIGFSDVVRQETLGPVSPPKYLEYVNDIHDSGLHLLSLINDVLDMAKIEAGKLELRPCELDIAIVAAAALRLVEAQAAESGLALSLDVESGLSLTADERAIRQILTNLLSNAVKFTPRGGCVLLFAQRTVDGGVVLGVEDTGVGMSPDGVTRAMQPFGQVEQTMAVEHRGTGLGLPIVKALVEAHGATFHVDTRPGEGTRVWAEFPAAEPLRAQA